MMMMRAGAQRKNVRLCCKQIGADRMVTLTYKENMPDRELALKHWKAFYQKLGKHKQFHYVAVIEEQARGALHFHVAVAGRQMYALLRSIWQGILGRGPNGEQMGQVHVRDPHRFGFGVAGAHEIASYIAKYYGKEMQCRALDQKRYFRSKGIVVPEVDVWRVPFCTNILRAGRSHSKRYQVIAWMAYRPGATNNLGVVYLATAPGLPQVVDDCPL